MRNRREHHRGEIFTIQIPHQVEEQNFYPHEDFHHDNFHHEDFHHGEFLPEEKPAISALKLETPQKISICGDAEGAALFDGAEDAFIKIRVKKSEMAIRDAQGNDIAKTYIKKNELRKYAENKEVAERFNYLEDLVHKIKNQVNNALREKDLVFATKDDIDKLFEGGKNGKNK